MADRLSSALRRLAAFLSEWGRPAALIGGMAVVVRVRPRFTDDIDAIVDVQKGALDDFLRLARRHGYAWLEGDRGMMEEGLIPLVDSASGAHVDLLVADNSFFMGVLGRAEVMEVSGAQIPVATVEDLILLKLDANRPQDLDDAIALLDAQENVDEPYLRAQADAIGIGERVTAFLGRAR